MDYECCFRSPRAPPPFLGSPKLDSYGMGIGVWSAVYNYNSFPDVQKLAWYTYLTYLFVFSVTFTALPQALMIYLPIFLRRKTDRLP